MKGLRSIRPLPRESLRGLEPSIIGQARPKFEWIDPKELFVEEAYQRDVRDNGVRLIRKIYAGFSWSRFKPPVCVRRPDTGNVLVCIDGQHTATAAASHPSITKIPVMVIDGADLVARAGAFVGHNRDRLGLTATAIYRAELVQGDPTAALIDRACRTAGAKIIDKSINLRNPTEVGATIAIGALRILARKQGEEFLIRVLKVLVGAKRGPIKAGEVAAAAVVLAEHPTADAGLLRVVASQTAEQWAAKASAISAETGQNTPSALAALWAKELGVQVSRSLTGTGASAARLVKRLPEAQEAPKPAPLPLPLSPAAKPAQAPAAAPAPAIPPARQVARNGVSLDLDDGRLAHRGNAIRLGKPEWRSLVAALVGVMPSILDAKRLEAKVFPGALDAPFLVRGMIADVNPVLRAARLEIVSVGKIGHVLKDLGA